MQDMIKVLVIGSEGSMGKRYQAILNSMRFKYDCVDPLRKDDNISMFMNEYTHFIVASPTDTHYEWLTKLIPLDKPILCEKPIVKDTKEWMELHYLKDTSNLDIDVMLQYMCIATKGSRSSHSEYNYFRTGPDSLVWNCTQTIGLSYSNTEITIKDTSPIWTCKVNGEVLNISSMDWAYMKYLSDWLRGERTSWKFIQNVHNRVFEFEQTAKKIEGGYVGKIRI